MLYRLLEIEPPTDEDLFERLEDANEEEEIEWAMYEKQIIERLHMERAGGLFRTDH